MTQTKHQVTQKFLKKSLASNKSVTSSAIAQKAMGCTKHRVTTIKEMDIISYYILLFSDFGHSTEKKIQKVDSRWLTTSKSEEHQKDKQHHPRV